MLYPLTHFRPLSRRQKCYVTIATLVTIVTTGRGAKGAEKVVRFV